MDSCALFTYDLTSRVFDWISQACMLLETREDGEEDVADKSEVHAAPQWRTGHTGGEGQPRGVKDNHGSISLVYTCRRIQTLMLTGHVATLLLFREKRVLQLNNCTS